MKEIIIEKPHESIILVGESYQNIKKYLPNDKQVIFVTDEVVFSHYAPFISQFPHIIIGCGEHIKTLETVAYVASQLLDYEADRKTFLVGFGGGLVTDVTGFVASIFMRGVSFGFVATSLLAQVDASLGGKNGVNFHSYKNMLGIFRSPHFVICDSALLQTLPQAELRSGFGELLKHSFIKDVELYDFLRENTEQLLNLNTELLNHIIHRSIEIKKEVVTEDPLEIGVRKQLNFGHTLGHAIENNSNLKHGEAVAVGMVWAAKLSVAKGFMCAEEEVQIEQLIAKYQLPTSFDISKELLKSFILKDKKKSKNEIDFVFLETIGKPRIETLSFEELFNLIDKNL